MTSKTEPRYENNPILIGIEGLKLIFTNAKSVGIYSIVATSVIFVVSLLAYIVLSIADALNKSPRTVDTTGSFDPAATLAVLVWSLVGFLVYFAVALLMFGILEYAAAMTAKGKKVGLQESFRAVVRHYPAYLWMYIIFTVKVLLWSLLFIVPGFIMANRYILAGTVFFAEGKRGNAAIKRSMELTRGAWLTTYGGIWVWNLLSQGIATMVFWPGNTAVLYRQLSARTDSNEPKPEAHILSWLTLLVPIALLVLYFMLIGMLILLIVASTAP